MCGLAFPRSSGAVSTPGEANFKVCSIPTHLSSLSAPGFAHNYMNKDSALSERAQKLRDFHPVMSVLMHLPLESAHSFAGAQAKENTARGRCHSRGTGTESPGCICFGTRSKVCREHSSVRAALLRRVSLTFLSFLAQLSLWAVLLKQC